jgi:hypothetical protein
MRSRNVVSTLYGVMFALFVVTGCDNGSEGQTHIANLPAPSQEVLDAAKAKARPNPRPRFGSPPKSEMGKP